MISINALTQDSGKVIPFSLINNHIYIKGFLNDTLPVSILLDCGAGTMLSDVQAKKAKIKALPHGQTDGIGDKLVNYMMSDSATFNLGSIRYTEKMIPVLSFTEIERCGSIIKVDTEGKIDLLDAPSKIVQPINAVLGDKFFRKFVVRIDYQKQIMTLYDPSSFQYNGNGERIPLRYSDNHIYVRASIAGEDSLSASGYFMVDCGSMTGIILNVPFIKHNKLSPSVKSTELSLCGIGGSSKSTMGTLMEIKLGTQRIEKPITIFSQASGGVLTRSDIAGSIGNGILRKFNVVFNYSTREMILE